MIIDPFISVKIGIVAVTLFCKYSLDIADMPLRKTDLKIEKVILSQLSEGIRIIDYVFGQWVLIFFSKLHRKDSEIFFVVCHLYFR